MLRKIIIALLFAASAAPAFAQFGGGGGCPTGGFMDRYSDQTAAGVKSFCNIPAFKMGMNLGTDPGNLIGLVAGSTAPTSVLFWGNRQVCDSSGNCPGGGGTSCGCGVVGGSIILYETGDPGHITIFNSTYSAVNSIIYQDNTNNTINFSTYTLTIQGAPGTGVVYASTGIFINTGTKYEITTTDKVNIKAGSEINLVSPTVSIAASSSLTLDTASLALTPTAISISGIPTTSGSFNFAGGCPPGQVQTVNVTKGLITSIGACH